MTLAAVATGTAFVAGTLFFTASAERSELAVEQRTDVAVQVTADGDGHLSPRWASWREFPGSRTPIRWCPGQGR
jgi:hypothetical protein